MEQKEMTEEISLAAVLDRGFVQLVDHMGDDNAVVQTARVSHRSKGTPEGDRKLIQYLWTHNHGTPFESAVFKWHVKAPVFVARQWFRHRIASFNEVSGRYTEMKNEFYFPFEWRGQDAKNKQGSSGGFCSRANIEMNDRLLEAVGKCRAVYEELLSAGVAREMARMVLPLNLYTEWYFTANARSLINFFSLRCDSHAQWETRQYANAMWKIFEAIMPWTAAAVAAGFDPEKYEIVKGEKP